LSIRVLLCREEVFTLFEQNQKMGDIENPAFDDPAEVQKDIEETDFNE
jgi:hypothetical protein